MTELKIFHTNLDFSPEEIREEPMFFCADPDFAYYRGGKITRAFLDNNIISDNLLDADLNGYPGKWYIDSRVHMLKPGWIPCIGGWHLDDVPRNKSGQPNIYDISEDIVHVMCCIGRTSMPEFLSSCRRNFSVEEIYENWALSDHKVKNNNFYKFSNQYINLLLEEPEICKVKSGDIVQFGQNHFHRGTKATTDDWRFFIRCSYGVERKFRNVIRTQVQAYIDIEEGW